MADIRKIRQHLKNIEEISPAGFAIAFHIRLTSPDFLFQTYPKDWIDLYSQKGFVLNDPIVRWGFAETGAIRWSSLVAYDDLGILEQSAPFGMVFGCAIATQTGTSRSVAGFARADREFSDDEITTLEGETKALHDLTAFKAGMPADLRDELQRLSLKMTHPSAFRS